MYNIKSRKGFEKVYNNYWEKVYAVCYNNTRKLELSQGMTQEIFKSLWERKDTLEIEHVENYLVRAAKFKVSNIIETKQSEKRI